MRDKLEQTGRHATRRTQSLFATLCSGRVSHVVRACLVTTVSVLAYVAVESPMPVPRTWPVLLNGLIGTLNAWCPPHITDDVTKAVQPLNEKIDALMAEIRARDENSGTRYHGPTPGTPLQPPGLPPSRGLQG